MQGHLKQKSNGRWLVQVYIGRDLAGKPKYRKRTFRHKPQAERWLHETIAEIEKGEFIDSSRHTLAEYLKYWLDTYAHDNVAPKTFERYEQIITKVINPAIGRFKLSRLLPQHIQRFYGDLRKNGCRHGKSISPQTILKYHNVLRKAFRDAVTWQIIRRSPCDFVIPPRGTSQPKKALTAKQAKLLLAVIEGSSFRIPAAIAICTGLCRGEVLALRWENVDLSGKVLHVRESLEQTRAGLNVKDPKTINRIRTVAMPDILVGILKEHQSAQQKQREKLGNRYHEKDLVYCRADGLPLKPDSFTRNFRRLMQDDKLKDIPYISFHGLRHTFTTLQAEAKTNPATVQRMAGHANISTTLGIYTHATMEMQHEAAQAMDRMLGDQSDSGNESARV